MLPILVSQPRTGWGENRDKILYQVESNLSFQPSPPLSTEACNDGPKKNGPRMGGLGNRPNYELPSEETPPDWRVHAGRPQIIKHFLRIDGSFLREWGKAGFLGRKKRLHIDGSW